MRNPTVNEHVRLVHDVPERQLCKDEIGIVRSVWFSPESFEIEFHHPGEDCDMRVLLRPEQFRIELDQECLQDA
jgi:hypothetical protein